MIKKTIFVSIIVLALLATVLMIPSASAQTARPPEDIEHFKWVMTFAPEHINLFWSKAFAAKGIPYRRPAIVPYDRPIQTQCRETKMNNASYCLISHTIYYDINYMFRQFLSYGDYAPVAVLAHEWGHAVQAQLGLTGISVAEELQADCFSGVYTLYAKNDRVLSDGDIGEAELSLFEAGDGRGMNWESDRAHGTPAQRVNNFRKGIYYGVGGCF